MRQPGQITLLAVAAGCAAILTFAGPGGSGQDPAVTLQRAIQLETVDGDLAAAIERYKEVIKSNGGDRSLAAQALLRLGGCYEKLGREEARKTYRQLVNEYADQQQEVMLAKRRLEALDSASGLPAPDSRKATRLLWSAPDADTSGEVSPDGRYLSYVDWVKGGDLAVRDLKTGQVRLLTNKSGWDKSGDFALNPRWSPDGKRLAYAWSIAPFGKQLEDQAELRITDAAGSGARVLHRSKTYLMPAGWFPDGKSILAFAMAKDDPGGIARVSAADGKIEMLRKFQWRSHGRVCLSPDGKYVAFDLEAAPDSLNKDVFLLRAAGGAERPLAFGPYDERLLAWTPDGHHILFASNRSGTYDLWLLRVENGKAVGAPKLLQQEFGMAAPIGFSPDGKFYFGREVILHDVFLTGWDPDAGRATSVPQKATEHFAGSTCRPAWSPDGKELAYVVQRGNLTPWIDNQVRVRDLATGQERVLPKASGAVRSIAWSPDGASLVMCGGSQPGKNSCRIVDATSGRPGREIAGARGSEIPGRAVWAPDGSAIYYATWKINEGRGRIVKRDVQSKQETVLYSLDRFHNPIYLDVSPDGRYLAFSLFALMEASKPLDPRIMLIPTAGGEARELAVRRDLTPAISWSHDSRHVYFSRRVPERNAHQLCRVPVSGGQIEELAFEIRGALSHLHIRPDGGQIAYMQVTERDSEIWVMENFLPPVRAQR